MYAKNEINFAACYPGGINFKVRLEKNIFEAVIQPGTLFITGPWTVYSFLPLPNTCKLNLASDLEMGANATCLINKT